MSSENKEIKGIDCKFVIHRPKTYIPETDEYTPDYHWIKERIVYKDGTTKDNFKCVKDFKRPFWITLPYKRNHKDHKESELEVNTKKYFATESDLWKEIGKALKIRSDEQRILRKSPYIYGADVNSRVFIKKAYIDKFQDCNTPYTVATLDIENDIDTDEINIISIAREWEIYTVVLKSYLNKIQKPVEKLHDIFNKHIPLDVNVKNTYEIFDSEIEMFKAIMDKAHEWGPDFLSIWNMDHELTYFINLCNKNNCDIADFFSDPSVPPKLRFFKYKKRSDVKVSASGVSKSSDVKDRWNTVYCPAKFYVIDAMCTYNYNRVNTKLVPDGYGLDNILKHELGERFRKLKFDHLNDGDLIGPDWHRYMVKHHPLEYVVYNQWDVLSMLVLENKTKDLKVAMPVLSGISPFDVYDSTPKRIVDQLLMKCLSLGKVLGCKLPMDHNDVKKDNDQILGLDAWVVTLKNNHIWENNSCKNILEDPDLATTIFTHVYDADQSSGYPSNMMELNLSKDTTLREIIDIHGIPTEFFKACNISLTFGPISHVEYCIDMLNFPTFQEIDEFITEKLKVKG